MDDQKLVLDDEILSLNKITRNSFRVIYLGIANARRAKRFYDRSNWPYKISDKLYNAAEELEIEASGFYRQLWYDWDQMDLDLIKENVQEFVDDWYEFGLRCKFYQKDDNGVYLKDRWGRKLFDEDALFITPYKTVVHLLKILCGHPLLVGNIEVNYFDTTR